MRRYKTGSMKIVVGIIILAIVLIGAVVISMKLINNPDNSLLTSKGEVETGSSSSDKELIAVYNSDKKAYGLIDVTGKTVLDFKYDKITPYYNTFKLEKDDEVTYVTKKNKSLKKYDEYKFDSSYNKDGDIIIAESSDKTIILNQNAQKIYELEDGDYINQFYSRTTSVGTWYILDTDKKQIVFNTSKMINEMPAEEASCITDNYICSEVDNKLTSVQYDNNGKIIQTINDQIITMKNDYYYVAKMNPQKSGYITRYDQKVYLTDGTVVAENTITDGQNVYIKDDIFVIDTEAGVAIYKNGIMQKELTDCWLDDGTSIINEIIWLENTSSIPYKTYYYDVNGNKLSDIDIENDGYDTAYANYINGYIYKGEKYKSDAKILNAKTGEIIKDNLQLASINDEFIDNTNGEYIIVRTNDGKSAILDKNMQVVLDYQEGYFTYIDQYVNPQNYNKDRIYFIKEKDGKEEAIIAYDIKNNFKEIFNIKGEIDLSYNTYFSVITGYYRFSYYDYDGNLIYEE